MKEEGKKTGKRPAISTYTRYYEIQQPSNLGYNVNHYKYKAAKYAYIAMIEDRCSYEYSSSNIS
jgi:hypothetical protein